MIRLLPTALPLIFLGAAVIAQELKPIELPAPDTTGGKPLMQVLKQRQSTREFGPDSIPLPVLSNLLWAACGVTRSDGDRRTAPSAMNWQEIEVYVATAHGLYLYDCKAHLLRAVLTEDLRESTGVQPFVKDVPINLIYVADYAKMTVASDTGKATYAAADAAFISENVYLFCASEGLATVVRGSVDRVALQKVMKLRPDQHVVFAQSVGYPQK